MIRMSVASLMILTQWEIVNGVILNIAFLFWVLSNNDVWYRLLDANLVKGVSKGCVLNLIADYLKKPKGLMVGNTPNISMAWLFLQTLTRIRF